MTVTSLKTALPETLRTTRLVLSAPALSDLDPLVALANNKAIADRLARLPHPYTHEDGEEFITTISRTPEEAPYAIHNEDGEFIGVAGFSFSEQKPPELGYWLGEPFWGRGYMFEATSVLVEAARAAGFPALFARSLADNAGSRNVLKKLGFVETRTLIDDCGPHEDREIVETLLDCSK